MVQSIVSQERFEKSYQKETATFKKWLADISYTPDDKKLVISNNILSDDYNLTAEEKLVLIGKLKNTYNKNK